MGGTFKIYGVAQMTLKCPGAVLSLRGILTQTDRHSGRKNQREKTEIDRSVDF